MTMFFVAAALTLCLTSATPKVVLNAETKAKLAMIAFQAARDGDLKTLTEFFAVGGSVHEVNARGDTLLTLAAYSKQPDAVALILKQRDVKVDARNTMGLTALSAAAFKGDVASLKLLLKAKADPNAANESRQTPIMFAALAGKVQAVELLLDGGADGTRADRAGRTPYRLAADQGADDVVKLLRTRGILK